jgi:hypothetical protein
MIAYYVKITIFQMSVLTLDENTEENEISVFCSELSSCKEFGLMRIK